MSGKIRNYFKDYTDSKENFENFHNQIINMPRPTFSEIGLSVLKVLASYLLLIEDVVTSEGNNYKEIMGLIHNKILAGVYPENRDKKFEENYFIFRDLDIKYKDSDKSGRMFRHYMELCAFWGLIKSISRQKKTINFDRCKDFVSLSFEQISTFVKNLSFGININNNDLINNLKGIKLTANANYHPTYAILKYINDIKRPVTNFEISILLGRIDTLQDEAIILKRALDIGNQLPTGDNNSQIQYFFSEMGWKESDGSLFSYTSSQEPQFKFQTYILFLEDFGFLEKDNITEKYTLTQEAIDLLGELPANVLDLNKIINQLDLRSGNKSDIAMKDVLIKYNLDTLKQLFNKKDFIKNINFYSLKHPTYSSDGSKRRNNLIAELARIRENYQCQAGTITFERPDGKNYVEVHHIIEFAKGGADVLENLLALAPTPHMQLHRGSQKAIEDMYINLTTRGAIKYDLFKVMVKEYNCLAKEHLDLLLDRKLISTTQRTELINILRAFKSKQ
ncbi:hypothetical protein [Candidatus Endomicrobiellum agilis]|uniref:hypothetical protein n=1 Tax=Candidatus Endomicrobiellum agilis TaxID=3238957 RepID=UPI00357429CD|nr:HNH endonuclease [Endomicrobium sp.]